MTAYIVQVSLGDTPRGTIEYSTIFAVGMMLFVITLLLNIVAQWLLCDASGRSTSERCRRRRHSRRQSGRRGAVRRNWAASSSCSASPRPACGIAGAGRACCTTIGADGLGRISWDFFTQLPLALRRSGGRPGRPLGTLWVMAFTALFAIPVGIGAAIWLEEFAPRNWLTKVIEMNIDNLAGVPWIIYGILGLAIFVRMHGPGPSVLAGALTLALMILPMIIVASHEGMRAVPPSIREASLASARRTGRRSGTTCCRRRCRDHDRHHPGPLARDRRDGAADHDRRASPSSPSRRTGPRLAVHGAADSDLQLDFAAASRVSPTTAAAGIIVLMVRAADDERCGRRPAQLLREEAYDGEPGHGEISSEQTHRDR